jgi:hypothetical protein
MYILFCTAQLMLRGKNKTFTCNCIAHALKPTLRGPACERKTIVEATHDKLGLFVFPLIPYRLMNHFIVSLLICPQTDGFLRSEQRLTDRVLLRNASQLSDSLKPTWHTPKCLFLYSHLDSQGRHNRVRK